MSKTQKPSEHVLVQQSDPVLELKLALRSDLRFEIRRSNHDVHYVIEDALRRKFFQIGSVEFEFIQHLDGCRDVVEVTKMVNANRGQNSQLSVAAAKKTALWLTQSNLVQTNCLMTSDRVVKSLRQSRKQKWMTVVNPLMFRVKLFNPDRLLSRVLPAVSWVFSRGVFAIWLVLIVVALFQIVTNGERLAESSTGILAGGRWIWLLVAWIVLKVIHEAGHGLACKKFGGEATETGILFLLFTPLAYVDVSSAWRFSNRLRRIIVSAAGMYVELCFAALAIIVWSNTSSEIIADISFNIFIIAGLTTILFNANPLMRFDGYYILADSIGIVNLYTRGQVAFQCWLRTLIGLPADKPEKLDRTNTIILIYGCLAFLWRITISLGLIIGASVLFHGFGLVFAIAGTVLWLGFPLFRFGYSIVQSFQHKTVNKPRFALAASIFALVVLATFAVFRAPAIKSAPAIVQFNDEQIVRSDSDGFLKAIHVFNGQTVARNQLMFELENPELNIEVEKIQTKLRQAEIQSGIYQQKNELASYQAELRNAAMLRLQLKEKQAELDSLKICAPTEGVVFARSLSNKIGSYLERGDALATVGQTDHKEIVLSLDQTDWDSFDQEPNKIVKVGFPGVSIFSTRLDRVNPRATDRPLHASLTAAYGGPLAVQPKSNRQPNDEQPWQLITKRFSATIELDEQQSKKVASGQRGVIYFRTPRQSFATYVFLNSRAWLRKKLQAATTQQSSIH